MQTIILDQIAFEPELEPLMERLHIKPDGPMADDLRALVRECLREQRGFAVCLISEGRETGQAARFHPVGTLAQIEDHDQDAAGMVHITVRGERRVQVVASRVRTDQLIVGDAVQVGATVAVNVGAGVEVCDGAVVAVAVGG